MSFVEFLGASPSAYHACAEVARQLREVGYQEQLETEPWDSTPGGHFVCRDGAIVAYHLGEVGSRFAILGAHTDSPGFKLKPRPQHSSYRWSQAGMEVYGGPLLNSWLDREFGLAGRVVLSTGEQRLVATDPWLRIPQLAPHLDRSVNDGLILNPQRHLMPVYAVGVRSLKSWKTPRAGTSGTSGNSDFRPVVDTAGVDIIQALAEVLGCAADEIMGHDLFAYITQPPEYFGVDKQFLAAGRLDNLSSVYPGLQALIAAEPSIGTIPVLACFDHEEVGSETRTGAGGTLLDDVLTRICLGLSLTADEAYQVRARSQMVSADAGHSIHPNYPEKHDLDEHPLMGAGPMIKINAQQRYTSDGPGRQLWAAICAEAGVPHQVFVSNNAVPCGSTIGPIASTRLGIPTVDVGIPLLSMHSAREMCAPIDVEYLTQALTVFFIG